MSQTRTLLLLRHAEAEETRPGYQDRDRRLSERGREQAAAVGETIRTAGWTVDHVLCSSAVRTQETLDALHLNDEVEVEILDALYDAGADGILELIATLPADAECAVVVGHAPGVPRVLHELVDAATADPAAWAVVESRYPPATLAVVALDDWADRSSARLVRAVPH